MSQASWDKHCSSHCAFTNFSYVHRSIPFYRLDNGGSEKLSNGWMAELGQRQAARSRTSALNHRDPLPLWKCAEEWRE